MYADALVTNEVTWTATNFGWDDVVAIEETPTRLAQGRYAHVWSKQLFSLGRTTVRAAGQGGFIFDNSRYEGAGGDMRAIGRASIDGVNVYRDEDLADNALIFGAWNMIVTALWGFVVAGSFREQANVLRNRIFILQYLDAVNTRPEAFVTGVQA